MSAGIPPIHSTPTTPPQPTSQSKTEIADLQNELQIFIQEAPDIEENLNDAQFKTAEKLIQAIDELHPRHKLCQFHTSQYQEQSPFPMPPPMDSQTGPVLHFMENSEDTMSILKLFKETAITEKINNTGIKEKEEVFDLETPKKALEGAEKYLDHLIDEQKKPEGDPEEALINRLREIQARGFDPQKEFGTII